MVSKQPEVELPPFTESSVRQRATVLFPEGAHAPVVKPRQPPIVKKCTVSLCAIALKISEEVGRVHGQLDGYATIGYLVADHMGIELLNDEALKVGTSARGHALRTQEQTAQKWKNASARRSKLRGKARAHPERVPDLERQLSAIDDERDVACAALERAEVDLNGLPPPNTTLVERRAPLPARCEPLVPPRPEATEPGPRSICERAHDRFAMAQTEDAVRAIGTAFYIARCKREGCDSYYIEDLETAEVAYKHALRRLTRAYPGEFAGMSERSWWQLVHWTTRMHALGFPIPAAERAAARMEMCVERPAGEVLA